MIVNYSILFGLMASFLYAGYSDMKRRTVENYVVGVIGCLSLGFLALNFDLYVWDVFTLISFAVACFLWLGAFYLSKGEGFGGADTKLLLVMLLFFPPIIYWNFVLLTFIIAFVYIVPFLVLSKLNRPEGVPLVIPMSISFVTVVLTTMI